MRLRLVLFLFILLCLPAAALEEIRVFATDVTLGADGTVEVVETIDVNAEGREIRRGIYRDIPVVMTDEAGNRVRPALEVIAVARNGSSEPFRVERMGDFQRIRIGDADVLLTPGIHRYSIHYTLTRMGRFFETHDELYWNATGNYWNFPIRAAIATLRLPEGAVISELSAYVGPPGSTEQGVAIVRQADGVAVFTAGRRLLPGEGMTVAAAFQKGVLVAPDAALAWRYWLADRQDTIIPILGVLMVLIYFSLAWSSVGRDPEKGVIIPLFHPPKGFSPGLTHYVHNWGWRMNGWTALTAAAFSLGVKGLLLIDNRAETLRMAVTGSRPAEPLPPGETVLFRFVSRRGTVDIDKENGKELQKTRQAFVGAIEGENRQIWFRNNTGYTLIGLLLAVAVLGAMVWLGYLEPFWLVAGGVIGVFGGLGMTLLKSLWTGGGFRVVFLAIWLVVAGMNLAGWAIDLAGALNVSSAAVAAVSIVALCVVFGILMRAPTVQGRKAMDEIEGLKLYIETAEKDRLNMAKEPPLTVERFERLLPYAIALGVEKPWSEHFEAELARTEPSEAQRSAYSPRWYRGRAGTFSPGKIAGAVTGAATGMSAAMVAAQPVSSSSSGVGGGGFSGGGGGGGGGGGW